VHIFLPHLLNMTEFMKTEKGRMALGKSDYLPALERWLKVIRRDQVFPCFHVVRFLTIPSTKAIHHQLLHDDQAIRRRAAASIYIPRAEGRYLSIPLCR
jgi:hypothetical protein